MVKENNKQIVRLLWDTGRYDVKELMAATDASSATLFRYIQKIREKEQLGPKIRSERLQMD